METSAHQQNFLIQFFAFAVFMIEAQTEQKLYIYVYQKLLKI